MRHSDSSLCMESGTEERVGGEKRGEKREERRG